MASSMLLALNTDWNSCQYHKEVNDPKQSFEWNKLLTATIQVCIEAEVDSNVASNCPYELTKFGSFLCLDIHYFDITEGNAEYSEHIDSRGEPLENAPLRDNNSMSKV